jgi:hypothetical protein
MPEGLTPRATVLLVALVFGLAFGIQALLGGGFSPSKPAPEPVVAVSTDADVAAARPDLRLVAAGTVPALRDPRKPPKRRKHNARKVKRSVRKVVAVAPTAAPEPAATPKPAATPAPAPRYTPPAPRQTPTPIRTPAPTPAPTTAPTDSGEFDTTGEP